MVADGDELTVKGAQERFLAAGLRMSDTTVRSYLAKDWLRGWYTGGNHARIEPESVDELVPLLRLRLGEERTKALDALAEANRAKRGAPPTE